MTNGDVGILVVDDEVSVRDSLSNWFRNEGYRVGTAQGAAEALQRLQESAWDVVLLDIRMPEMDGLELQERIAGITPPPVVIIMTGYASVESAVRALKAGAFDYVMKPIEPDRLTHVVRNATEQRRLRAEVTRLREQIEEPAGRKEIVGESPAMRAVLELVDAAARSESPVLIRGEAGTGRAHVARAIHAHSRRRYFPFVPVSCAAATAGVLDRELFGETGDARKGSVAMADGGTLYLDELGAVPPGVQATLLGVLDARHFVRPGASHPDRANVRLIGATERTRDELVAGGCREDFLYRIEVVTIELPPLRDRAGDVPLLARHFLGKYAAETNRDVTAIDPDAVKLLDRYGWPGNVRELAAAVEHAVVVSREAVIRPADLPPRLRPAPGG